MEDGPNLSGLLRISKLYIDIGTLRSETYISRFICSWKSDQVKSCLIFELKVRVSISLPFTRISILFAKKCDFI